MLMGGRIEYARKWVHAEDLQNRIVEVTTTSVARCSVYIMMSMHFRQHIRLRAAPRAAFREHVFALGGALRRKGVCEKMRTPGFHSATYGWSWTGVKILAFWGGV